MAQNRLLKELKRLATIEAFRELEIKFTKENDIDALKKLSSLKKTHVNSAIEIKTSLAESPIER